MANIAIVYWSGTGNTEKMANEIADYIKQSGNSTELFTADSFTRDMVDGFDGFAFGCPATGTEELEEYDFLPMWDAVKDGLKGKKLVLFGSYGWGGGPWMDSWKADCDENSLTVEGVVICNETPEDDTIAECKDLADKLL